MSINYQIYHRVRLKQIRFKFKVVKHFINQMKPFCHFAKPWRWDGDETICEMNQKEEKRSQPSSIILSRPFWNKKSHYTAGCSNFVAWIRSRKILKWNSPKGAWSITSFSFLQHIFYNSVSKNSLAGIFHANDFPLTGSSLVQRLRCPCRARVFLPTNATGSIQSFRALQKFWKPRVLRSFSLSVNVTKYANLSRTYWSERIVFQVLTGRICFL